MYGTGDIKEVFQLVCHVNVSWNIKNSMSWNIKKVCSEISPVISTTLANEDFWLMNGFA